MDQSHVVLRYRDGRTERVLLANIDAEQKVASVQRDPKFHYNPELFWDAKEGDSKTTLPPGPNNPVGLVWIDLSHPHTGIHGTPEPSRVGLQTNST